MGLTSFNRMRLRLAEQMKPENIAKQPKEVKKEIEETKEAVEEVKENIAEDIATAEKENTKEDVKRGSSKRK